MATLLFKVGILAMKTISKPLAERFKGWAMSHPTARQTVLRVAQRLHRFEVLVSRRAEGKEGRAFVGNMTDEASVDLASKVASESFVFMVGALLIFLEYDRNRRKDIAKQRKEQAERTAMQETAAAEHQRLEKENEMLQQFIQELVLRVDRLEELVQQASQQKQPNNSWGGFFGPRGLT